MDDRIRKVIAASLGVPEEEIDDDTSSANLEQWDSLRHMNLILALEEEFGVEFDEDWITEMTSVREIRSVLEGLAQE